MIGDPELRKLFNERCKELGWPGSFKVDSPEDGLGFPLYDHVRRRAHELIDSARHHLPGCPQIHFEFIEAPSVNACAFKYSGKYFIGINAGAIVMLHLLLTRILATPTTFPNIGDASRERDSLPPTPWAIVDAKKLHDLGIRPVLPIDEIRTSYSLHLADQAVMFLVGHELAHISRGHVDFACQSGEGGFLAELGWQAVGDAEMIRQAIETDADWRSIQSRLQSNHEAVDGQLLSEHWDGTPITVDALHFDALFAVGVLFRLFGDQMFSPLTLATNSYPPLSLRRRLVLDFSVSLLLTSARLIGRARCEV